MYICVCKAVSDHDIHEAVLNGASTVKHLRDTLGVGKDCGLCIGCAKQCLREAKDNTNTLHQLGNYCLA
jgi:bacterioferritin-associated ferredoxin